MNLEDYKFERSRIFHLGESNNECMSLLWASNALGGETGELQNIVKKIYRDDAGKITPETLEKIKDEAGDVFWYFIFMLEEICKIPIEEIMDYNMQKLRKRYGY